MVELNYLRGNGENIQRKGLEEMRKKRKRGNKSENAAFSLSLRIQGLDSVPRSEGQESAREREREREYQRERIETKRIEKERMEGKELSNSALPYCFPLF